MLLEMDLHKSINELHTFYAGLLSVAITFHLGMFQPIIWSGNNTTCIFNNFFLLPPRDEYDFLPVPEPKHNRSPLVLQEHKLGIESWSVKILFQYAYNQLISWRNNTPPTKFLGIVFFNEDLCQWLIKLQMLIMILQ